MNVCGHELDDHVCAKTRGHAGFHREGAYMWGTGDESVTFVGAFAVAAVGDPTASSRS